MTRDVLRNLTEARPHHLDPSIPTPTDTREKELTMAMTGQREETAQTPRPTRRARRPLWAVGLVAAAGVTAAAVVVSTTGTGTKSIDKAGPTAGSNVVLSARTVLLSAAESSLKTPVAGGAYWFVEDVNGFVNMAGTKVRYLIVDRSSHRQWTARSPKGNSWFADQGLGAGPFTAEGKAAWMKDGSPTSWKVTTSAPKADNKNAVDVVTLSSAPRKLFGGQTNLGDKVFDLAGKNVTVAQIQALPGDMAGLKKRLLQGYAGHSTEANDPMARDPWLFQITIGLLRDMPVKPATRAAAYKILAGLKGVRALGQVIDPLGRKGQAIGLNANYGAGMEQRQIIVNPETGLLLADQTVALRPAGANAWAKPGTVLRWEATRSAGWSDSQPVKVGSPSPLKKQAKANAPEPAATVPAGG
jgi:hypothetical protein